MKTLQYIFFGITLSILCFSCTSSKQSTSRTANQQETVDRGYDTALEKDATMASKTMRPNEKHPSNLSLADMIRQESGVTVSGQGNSVTVRVRGASSFGPSDPLYIVNGTDLGYDYARVAGALNTNEIISITVLKGTDAAIYGSRGGNGVIVIRTR